MITKKIWKQRLQKIQVASFSGKIKNREMIFKNENDYKKDMETTITKNLEN